VYGSNAFEPIVELDGQDRVLLDSDDPAATVGEAFGNQAGAGPKIQDQVASPGCWRQQAGGQQEHDC
jgi:hypothetical protein